MRVPSGDTAGNPSLVGELLTRLMSVPSGFMLWIRCSPDPSCALRNTIRRLFPNPGPLASDGPAASAPGGALGGAAVSAHAPRRTATSTVIRRAVIAATAVMLRRRCIEVIL